jgi:hypothetical protein
MVVSTSIEAGPDDATWLDVSRTWLPLAVVLPIACLMACEFPAWIQMWILAIALFLGLKWLTFVDNVASGSAVSHARAVGYLLLWPGMDAHRFLAPAHHCEPSRVEWCWAVMKTVTGMVVVYRAARLVERAPPVLAGWLGMCGIVLTLHFGLFHLLSVAWRKAGVDAPPIMEWPILATSAGDFWGRRWNRAFRDVASPYVFRPLVGQFGAAGATMAVFLVSGLVHDLVISLPARAGWGLPTLYFVIQGCAVLAEHSRFGKRLGLGRGVVGRAFCLISVSVPLPLLFHAPFVDRVIVPMLSASR